MRYRPPLGALASVRSSTSVPDRALTAVSGSVVLVRRARERGAVPLGLVIIGECPPAVRDPGNLAVEAASFDSCVPPAVSPSSPPPPPGFPILPLSSPSVGFDFRASHFVKNCTAATDWRRAAQMPPSGLLQAGDSIHGRCHASCCRLRRRRPGRRGGREGDQPSTPGPAQGSGEQWRLRPPPRDEQGLDGADLGWTRYRPPLASLRAVGSKTCGRGLQPGETCHFCQRMSSSIAWAE